MGVVPRREGAVRPLEMKMSEQIRTVPGSGSGDYGQPLPTSSATDFLARMEREDEADPAGGLVAEDVTEQSEPEPGAAGVVASFGSWAAEVDAAKTERETAKSVTAGVEPSTKPARNRQPVERTYKPCACQQFALNDGSGTSCSANVTSKRSFAPGHDAKLKSMVIRAGRANQTVTRLDSDGKLIVRGTGKDVAKVLAEWPKLVAAVDAAVSRETKPRTRSTHQAPEAVEAMTEVTASRMAFIKVGRWTYEAEIGPDGTATYETKAGESKTVVFADYAEVESDSSPEQTDEF